MGGGKGGAEASRIVAETLIENMHEFLGDRNGSTGKINVERLLRGMIERANARV